MGGSRSRPDCRNFIRNRLSSFGTFSPLSDPSKSLLEGFDERFYSHKNPTLIKRLRLQVYLRGDGPYGSYCSSGIGWGKKGGLALSYLGGKNPRTLHKASQILGPLTSSLSAAPLQHVIPTSRISSQCELLLLSRELFSPVTPSGSRFSSGFTLEGGPDTHSLNGGSGVASRMGASNEDAAAVKYPDWISGSAGSLCDYVGISGAVVTGRGHLAKGLWARLCTNGCP